MYPIKPTVRIVCSPDTRLFTTYAPNGSVYNTYPANWIQGPLDVLGTADNSSGLIRLQLASTSQIRTGDNITVAGVQGTTEANGDWNNVTVVDGTHVDLPGSTYTHTFSGGGGIVVPNNSWLQNAINLAVDGGYSLVIEAQGGRNSDNSVGPTTLCSRGPINIPTALFLSVDFSSVEMLPPRARMDLYSTSGNYLVSRGRASLVMSATALRSISNPPTPPSLMVPGHEQLRL